MPARPRGLPEPCAATSGTHGSEEGGAGKRRPLSDRVERGTEWVAVLRDSKPIILILGARDLAALRYRIEAAEREEAEERAPD